MMRGIRGFQLLVFSSEFRVPSFLLHYSISKNILQMTNLCLAHPLFNCLFIDLPPLYPFTGGEGWGEGAALCSPPPDLFISFLESMALTETPLTIPLLKGILYLIYPAEETKVNQSYRLWSMWDMIQFLVHNFYDNIRHLHGHEYALLDAMERPVDTKPPLPPDSRLTQNDISLYYDDLSKISINMRSIGLVAISMLLDEMIERLPKITLVRLQENFKQLNKMIEKELSKYLYIYISPIEAMFYEKDNLFGEKVSDAFSSANYDIREAGNCYATGRYTACVFHLMRAVEWGLRALCADVGFKEVCLDKKIKKFVPVAYSDWERILSQLSRAVDKKIEKIKRGPDKQSSQEFYYPLLQEIKAFKEAWRNHVMHTRREYNQKDAISIFTHVKNFMVRLSSRIRES